MTHASIDREYSPLRDASTKSRGDYRVTIKVRNARLLRAIEQAGYRPGRKFSEIVGIGYTNHLLPYLKMELSPFTDAGDLRESAEKLCEFFKKMPHELWTDAQINTAIKSVSEFDVGEDVLRKIAGGVDYMRIEHQPDVAAEKKELVTILDDEMKHLTARERDVLSMRYGLDGEPMTFEKISEDMGLTSERVRQIELHALRKLRRKALA